MRTEITTQWGNVAVGDKYTSADGAGHQIVIVDVDTYFDVTDVVIRSVGSPETRRMDWFKLSYRYMKITGD